jgi:hypothetical protein
MFSLEELGDRKSPIYVNTLNMTIRELINMYVAPPEEVKMVISPKPDQQKEWTDVQKSRLIESIFLDLPIPGILLLDTGNGGIQLLDGRKRIYAAVQFINASILGLEPLILSGCELVPELNGKSFADLDMRLKIAVKLSTFEVSVLIVKRRSNPTEVDKQNKLALENILIERLKSFNFA